MDLHIKKSDSSSILRHRTEFLSELNHQFIFNSYHARGWADVYKISLSGDVIGYAALFGNESRETRDTLFEFYLMPEQRNSADEIFKGFVRVANPKWVTAQSNDELLYSMLVRHGNNLTTNRLLFEACQTTSFQTAGTEFRLRRADDEVFVHTIEPVGDYVIEQAGNVVATGGFLTHYNQPFVDLFMEVHPDKRKQNFATYLLQEIQKVCRSKGFIPAARCHVSNEGSRRALLKAGMRQCGVVSMAELSD